MRPILRLLERCELRYKQAIDYVYPPFKATREERELEVWYTQPRLDRVRAAIAAIKEGTP